MYCTNNRNSSVRYSIQNLAPVAFTYLLLVDEHNMTVEVLNCTLLLQTGIKFLSNFMVKRTQILPGARPLNLVHIVYRIAMGICETQHGLKTVELGVSVAT